MSGEPMTCRFCRATFDLPAAYTAGENTGILTPNLKDPATGRHTGHVIPVKVQVPPVPAGTYRFEFGFTDLEPGPIKHGNYQLCAAVQVN
ncbi:MAG: hypothetical protein ABSH30_18390 [Acidimicrobiales bacterium]